jgi:hypothetical protein
MMTPGRPTQAARFASGSRSAAAVTADSGVSRGSWQQRTRSPAAAKAWQYTEGRWGLDPQQGED